MMIVSVNHCLKELDVCCLLKHDTEKGQWYELVMVLPVVMEHVYSFLDISLA